jgi:hypothetical protein
MMVWWHRISQLFRSGSILLSNRDGNKVSEGTIEKVQTIFDVLRANPKISLQRLEVLLLELSKSENIFSIHDEGGYNLLQKSVGLNHIELARWLLHRHRPDVNRSACSLPLHIACLKVKKIMWQKSKRKIFIFYNNLTLGLRRVCGAIVEARRSN